MGWNGRIGYDQCIICMVWVDVTVWRYISGGGCGGRRARGDDDEAG